MRMNFGLALAVLKAGGKVTRDEWADAFLYLVPGSEFRVNRAPLSGIYPEGTNIRYGEHIDLKKPDGSCIPWVATQCDLLASDWKLTG